MKKRMILVVVLSVLLVRFASLGYPSILNWPVVLIWVSTATLGVMALVEGVAKENDGYPFGLVFLAIWLATLLVGNVVLAILLVGGVLVGGTMLFFLSPFWR